MEQIAKQIIESEVGQSIRRLLYISHDYFSNAGTGIIIKLNNKYYLSCLYHSFSDRNNEIDEEAVRGLRIMYKTYLGDFDRENIELEKLLLIPMNCSATTIQNDLMLSEEILTMELAGINNLTPHGYLDFDDDKMRQYLLSDKDPILGETLFAYGFPLEKNEIDFEISDDGSISQINRVNHEARLFGGRCIRDGIGFAIKKEDANSEFGMTVNGMSGGVVLRACGNSIEWVGIAMRANDDLIRFIPYYLVAKSIVKNISDREINVN